MSFSQATITSVNYHEDIGALNIDWTTTSPAGTWFQVYVNGAMVARTRSTGVSIPKPAVSARITVGSVDSSDSQTRFTATLPAKLVNQAKLAWTGGLFLGGVGKVGGFRVYSAIPAAGFGLGGFGSGGYGSDGGYGLGGFGVGGFGGNAYSINYPALADIPAYTSNQTTDGFGMGGFGAGGFGSASASYSWTSAPLPGGLWTFAVAPYDTAGNVGAPLLASVSINAPPAAPAAYSDGELIHYVVAGFGGLPFGSGGFGESVIELSWNPSPGG
jgi:hypothetical protein